MANLFGYCLGTSSPIVVVVVVVEVVVEVVVVVEEVVAHDIDVQISSSVAIPWHAAPPFIACCASVLFLSLLAMPHVLLHGDHWPHVLH